LIFKILDSTEEDKGPSTASKKALPRF